MKIPMLDIYAKAEIGKSLAGLVLGDKLQKFTPFVDNFIDGRKVGWNIDIIKENKGVLLYKWPDSYGGGQSIFISSPDMKLKFSDTGRLSHIIVGEGYKGVLFADGIKIGSRLGDIECPIVLDDTEDVHYLGDGQGGVIEGIYFVADGLEVDDDPDQRITEVRVYDHSIE